MGTRLGIRFLVVMMIVYVFAFNLGGETVQASSVYYVSTTGDDITGTGTLSNPWKTIQKAADTMTAGDTCIIRGGTYQETVTLRTSGTSVSPINFKAYPGENVTVSGADPITGWEHYSGSIYYAEMTGSLGTKDQIFVNKQMQFEARWPNSPTLDPLNSTLATVDFGSATTIKDGDLTQEPGYWVGKTVWSVPGTGYKSYRSTITSSSEGSITFEHMAAAATGGNSYYITGNLEDLDSAGEWYYDSMTSRLYLWAPGGVDPNTLTVEAKKRTYAFDLSSRSYINITGINIFASSIKMSNSNYCKVSNMIAEYVSHDSDVTSQYSTGIFMSGTNNELRDSTLTYSSGNLVSIQGTGNKVINNLIHEANYSAADIPAIYLLGANHLISHNTVYNAGRHLIFMPTQNSRIQYNNLYNAGKLTRDLGILYDFAWDGQGTEIHHNYIHDNLAKNYSGTGIYLDNGSKGYIVHHNVVWGNYSAIRLNTPSNFNLIYNNTTYSNGNVGYWGSNFQSDLYGDRIFNNIFTTAFTLPGTHIEGNNITSETNPLFVNPTAYDFRLKSASPAIDAGAVIPGITDDYVGAAPDIGAYEFGGTDWTAGHDFSSPPNPFFENVSLSYVNNVRQSDFEKGIVSPWEATYSEDAASVSEPRSGSKSVRLGTGEDGIEQVLTGLSPNTSYICTAWVKADLGEQIQIGVNGFEGTGASATSDSTSWTMIKVPFTTGEGATRATLYAYKNPGTGYVYVDDFGVVEQ
ncbi:carbohydrate binding domain-containing protein [Paenibacillus sp. FSL K6-1230]|uniref:carbohydrate binding domain-containing protein n=1 Tax=Paenibacillus sp. FSL K6-1230 TaxID=2921603 RepID=UPI0030F7C2F7